MYKRQRYAATASASSVAAGDAIVAATVTNGREEIKLVFFVTILRVPTAETSDGIGAFWGPYGSLDAARTQTAIATCLRRWMKV